MTWTDRALLLSVTELGKDRLALHVLTRRHGRCQGTLQIQGKAPVLRPGSALDLDHAPGELDGPGEFSLRGVSSGVETGASDDICILILAYVTRILEAMLRPGEPAAAIHDASAGLVTALMTRDGRWPIHFAVWELSVLAALGCAGGLERCRPAFRHGEAIYISPRTGRAATRVEAGAFLDRMMPVPGCLMGARNASVAEVRQALEMTRMLFERFACPAAGVKALPVSRQRVVRQVLALKAIPRVPTRPVRDFGDDDRVQIPPEVAAGPRAGPYGAERRF